MTVAKSKKKKATGVCQVCGIEYAPEIIICADCFVKSASAPDVYRKKTINDAPTLNKDGSVRKKKGEGIKKLSSGFPRGWHFKAEYIHTDGTKYVRGIKVEN